MLNFEEKQRLMALLPEFQLMSGIADAQMLKENGAVDAKSVQEAKDAYGILENRKGVFYSAFEKEDVSDILEQCRIIANSMEELAAINAAARAKGITTMVGLRLTAEDFRGDAMTTAQLRGLVHDIKQLKNISVCGCIVTGQIDGLHGKELGKFVRSSYRTAKAMTYILPCSMPYIVLEGLMEAIARNEAAHPEDFQDFLTAANIVGMQNATAFYANYYIE